MKSDTQSDDDLIRGCRENSRKCQEMLYRRYAKTMYNLCLVYEADRDKAKDILQEAFIKIFKSISSFDRFNPINGWMRKIITNTAIDHYRKNHRTAEYIQIDSMVVQPFSNEDPIASILNADDIIAQVNRLPNGARMIFKLHAIEGYSHKEIAGLLHISEGTSKSQVNRAKALLQQWMGSYYKKYSVIEEKG